MVVQTKKMPKIHQEQGRAAVEKSEKEQNNKKNKINLNSSDI